MPALLLAGSPFLAARPGVNPSRICSRSGCAVTGPEGNSARPEAGRRGGGTEEEREKGGGGRAVPDRRQRGRSDALVFVRAVHEAKWMNEMEISIYDSCCLLPSKGGGSGVLSVSQLPVHMERSLPVDIREQVPALVLDCEHDIDFNKDIEAKRQYARQVAKFFEFVKKQKESPTAEMIDGDKSINKQIVLPQGGGLWVPGKSPLPESALKSFDFRRTMSSFLST
ncbi:hypothetical protein HU200_007557 [Digitaria exilis]|uniref:Uncharacterized protein n=1 Tax=Digitaria exilis TaxID=1010633 RepID=A0A835KR26_9POAL|nr:hypothetical protein HU200_007557 [Digitaria exilis]